MTTTSLPTGRPAPTRRSGRSPSTVLLLLRGTPSDRASQALPVLAFAVVTALTLTVAGGAEFFFTLEEGPGMEGLRSFYSAMAGVAVALLAVPLLSLSASAVKLSTRRRDTRLSSLRLVGAPRRLLHTLAVVEATGLAAAGAVLGVVLHLVLAPLFGLLTFAGTRLGTAQIVPPAWLGALVLLVVVGTAALAAVLGLRQVAITPLGVRTRQDAPPLRRLPVVVGVAALVGLYVVADRVVPEMQDELTMVVTVAGLFAGGLAVLGLIGPPVLAFRARRSVRRADGPRAAERLLAARTLLDDPRAAWRMVSGVAMVSFVSVLVGVATAIGNGADTTSPHANPVDAMLVTDLRTGVLLTIGLSYLTLAAAVTVHSAAEVFDRRQLYVALDRLGMPRETIERSRGRAVLDPVVAVTAIGAGAAGLLTLPLAGMALLTDPATVAMVVGSLVAGVLAVRGAVRLTRPLVTQVLATAEPVV